MHNRGSLRLTLVTLSGKPIGELVEIRLRNSTRTDARVKHVLATRSIFISDLETGPNGWYEVEVFPGSFERHRCVVEIHAEKTTELCIVFHGDHPVCPPTIPDQLDESAVASLLTVRLVGTPANGVPIAATSTPPTQVVWVNGSNEVLVHLDSTQVRILDGLLLVSVDLETDQIGRSSLVCAYALGTTGDQAGLVATTDEFPRGNGNLAATWGKQLQQAIWSSILSLSKDHASERNQAARGVFATAGKLSLQAGNPLTLS